MTPAQATVDLLLRSHVLYIFLAAAIQHFLYTFTQCYSCDFTVYIAFSILTGDRYFMLVLK